MTKSTLDETVSYRGLREWLERSEGFGELLKIDGAHWDTEMGAITHMMTEKSRGQAPAILFDNIPGYPAGFRTLYGQFSSIKRVALTLGLPLEHARKVDIVKAYHERIRTLKPLPPKIVETGPILENVVTGDACDVLKFPVPRHHEADKARFIGTADGVITLDPDEGWYNVGAYRSQVYDGKTIGCQITEGKHGRIHRDKYFERGEPMKVVILCGQDPLLFMLSASPLPDGISEIDFMGGLRGEPVECVRGPFTGFPIPADCEIAIEGEMVPGQALPEGPFGEWMGYYSDDSVPRPYVNVKTILHRNNPILCCAPQHKPVDGAEAGSSSPYKKIIFSGAPDYPDTGKMGDNWGTGLPFDVTPAVVSRGQERYGIYCAVCHGATGAGNGIAKQLGVATVQSLIQERIRVMSDGEIFNTITHGKNTMLGYGERVQVPDRWAIIAYVRALQKSQGGATLSDVPEAERAKLEAAQ
jgi:UbiD family decarboxylase